ncbi:hypothetical protein F2Q70_00044101 [Brassica cretica]|uniref:Uncharacterized protein n=1 Tax=Brassica cretica TaxID=69181 RepID=A0A8S9KJI7_BRACR|nr:hypothetical protein F2Q70_00044101 [Brassica cretica]
MSYPLELDQSCLIRDRELVALDWMWSHGKSPASKNEIFIELEPLDCGGGLGGAGDGDGGSNGGNVVMIMLQTKSINWKCLVSLSAASRYGGLGGLVPSSSMATITNSHDAANHQQRHKTPCLAQQLKTMTVA